MGCGASAPQQAVGGPHAGSLARPPMVSGGSFKLRVFSINDVYKLDNLARLKSALDHYKANKPAADRSILTLNGDLIGGCLLFSLDKGTSIIDCCNELGVDFMCLGNHEFDHGVGELEKRVLEFRGTWLNSNVVVGAAKAKPEGPDPGAPTPARPGSVLNEMARWHVEVLANGFRIGLLGVCTTDSPSLCVTDPTKEGVSFLDVFAETRKILDAHAGEVDAIIALTHQSNADDERFLKEFPEIQLVLGGHDHVAWSHKIESATSPTAVGGGRGGPSCRLAVKAGLDAECMDVIEYSVACAAAGTSSQRATAEMTFLSHELVPLVDGKLAGKSGFPPDVAMGARIQEHKKILSLNDFCLFDWGSFDAELRQWAEKSQDPTQIGCWTTKDIRSRQVNFVHLIGTWIKRELSSPDSFDDTVMIVNSGQFRANLDYDYSERMSFNDMNRELAFNNKMMKVKILGSDILAVLTESETARKGQGGYLQYDPAAIELVSSEAENIYTIKSVNGKAFAPEKMYTVMLVVKMLDGMDNWVVLTEKYGKKLPNLGAILDSSPGMADLVVNHLLKEKWIRLEKFWAAAGGKGNDASSSDKKITFEDLKQFQRNFRNVARGGLRDSQALAAGTPFQDDRSKNSDEEDELMLKMMFDLLDVNKDGVIDENEIQQMVSGQIVGQTPPGSPPATDKQPLRQRAVTYVGFDSGST
mmetsp:Transcript_15073/g.37542  ORF Transcript_15073/g.37542 Transcript_15073/m.37542 type:complete len:699 (-) Transcript_15073:349-2445(-)